MVRPMLVYADQGTSELGVKSLLKNIPLKLGLSAKAVTAQDILQGALTKAKGLVIAGGADLPYCEKLNGRGNQLIRDFVQEGGFYLGICAGAYYACQAIEFEGNGYQIYGDRELALFNGIGKGSLVELTNGHLYDETSASKAFVSLKMAQNRPLGSYYHGGCAFLISPQALEKPSIFAQYPNGLPAIISGRFGNGRYLLSGVHFELDQACYRQHCCTSQHIEAQEKEYQLCELLTSDYGDEVWNAINRMLAV